MLEMERKEVRWNLNQGFSGVDSRVRGTVGNVGVPILNGSNAVTMVLRMSHGSISVCV